MLDKENVMNYRLTTILLALALLLVLGAGSTLAAAGCFG